LALFLEGGGLDLETLLSQELAPMRIQLAAQGQELAPMRIQLAAQKAQLAAQDSIVAGAAEFFVDRYSYSAGKVTGVERSRSFKADLATFYGVDQGHCMLLDCDLGSAIVRGAHLFKHVWHKTRDLELLGLDDIDDPRNGLFLFRPVVRIFLCT
jgi:hypothetical protein